VSLPHVHEVGEHLIGSLAPTLEVWVEADIVGDPDIVDGDLATTVLIEHAVSLVHHLSAAFVKVASDGAQKLVER
jgi:hypothetical protein